MNLTTVKEKIKRIVNFGEKIIHTDLKYLIKGGFWLTFGQIIASLSSFALSVAFANLVSQETYGQYKYVLSIVSVISVCTLPGMNIAATQAVANRNESSIFNALRAKKLGGLLGMIISTGVALYYYFNNNYIIFGCLIITALFMPFMEAYSLYDAYLGGKKKFKTSSLYSIIAQITGVALMVSAMFFFRNTYAIILAYFTAHTCIRLLLWFFSIKKYPPNNKKDPDTVVYGAHLTLQSIWGTIAGNVDKFILWHLLGPVAVATYAFSMAPVNQISSLMKFIIPLSFPKLATRDSEEIKKTLPRKMRIFLIFIVLGILIYLILIPYFYQIFFPKYTGAIRYAMIYASILLFFPQKLIGTALQAKKKTKELYFFTISSAILRTILYLVMIPIYGIMGAILTNVSIYIWGAFLQGFFLKKL